jgi:hypothetical protein
MGPAVTSKEVDFTCWGGKEYECIPFPTKSEHQTILSMVFSYVTHQTNHFVLWVEFFVNGHFQIVLLTFKIIV